MKPGHITSRLATPCFASATSVGSVWGCSQAALPKRLWKATTSCSSRSDNRSPSRFALARHSSWYGSPSARVRSGTP